MGPQITFVSVFSLLLLSSILNVTETVQDEGVYRRPLLPSIWSAVRTSTANQLVLTEKIFFDSMREIVRVDQRLGNQSSIHMYFFGESRFYKITPGTDEQATCEKLDVPATFIEDQSLLDGLEQAELQVFPGSFYRVAYVWHTGGTVPNLSDLNERSQSVSDVTFFANNKTAVYYEDSETGNPLRWIVNNITFNYNNVKEEAIDLALLTPPPLLRCPGFQRRYTRDVQSITPPSFPPYWSANRVRKSLKKGTFFDIFIYDGFASSLQITSSASSAYQSSSFYFSNFHEKTNYVVSSSSTGQVTCEKAEASAIPFFEDNSLVSGMTLTGLFFKQGVLIYCWKSQVATFCDDAFSRLPVSLEYNDVVTEYSSVKVERPDPSVFAVNSVQACSPLIKFSFEDIPPIKVPQFPSNWRAVVSNPPHSSVLEFDYARQVFRETPLTNGSPDTRIYFMEKKRSYRVLRDAATHIYPMCLTARYDTTRFYMDMVNIDKYNFEGQVAVNQALCNRWNVNSTGGAEQIFLFDVFSNQPVRVIDNDNITHLFENFEAPPPNTGAFWAPLQLICNVGENITVPEPIFPEEMEGLPYGIVAVIGGSSFVFGVLIIIVFILMKNIYLAQKKHEELASFHRLIND